MQGDNAMTIRKIDSQELPPGVKAALRAEATRMSARSEEFWLNQRVRIRARVKDRQTHKPSGLRLAMAAAFVLCFALLLVTPGGRQPEVRTNPPQFDADQQLLMSVERALSAGTPEALEPLTLIVESSSNLNDSETSHKEQLNEN